jgi:DNA-directed RNA polymerase specialized sigma24 family protein
MNTQTRVAAAKQRELESRKIAENAAAEYRREVSAAVAEWRHEGLSVRKCAERMGITEGALRDLLRPAGTARRAKKRPPAPQS